MTQPLSLVESIFPACCRAELLSLGVAVHALQLIRAQPVVKPANCKNVKA